MGTLPLAKQQDLMLIPFPYSDLAGRKVRPVLVLSNNTFNEKYSDVIVCAITSNLIHKEGIIIDSSSLSEGVLHSTCCVKPMSIHTLDKHLLIKKIGVLNTEVFAQIKEKILEQFS